MANTKKKTNGDPAPQIAAVLAELRAMRADMDAGFKELRAEVQAVDASLGTLRQDMEHVPAQQTAILTEFVGLRGEAHRDLEDHRKRIERLEKRTGTR
jgi:hypothetical protein